MSRMLEHLEAVGYCEIDPEAEVPVDFITSLPEELGYVLPSDYLTFLRAFPRNGGMPGWAYVRGVAPFAGAAVPMYEWIELFGFSARPSSGLVLINQSLDPEIPGYITIGEDVCSNKFFMRVDGISNTVHFLDGSSWDGRYIIADSFPKVAENFQEFIMNSYPQED